MNRLENIKKEIKLSSNLNNYKSQYNLSIPKMCKIFNMNYQRIKDILDRKQIGKVRTIEKIADTLDLTIDKLLFEDINFS
uniref:hypothetical protein n=1 Tax=Paraclostridium sordellii TaxID=1505 RepID=UPI00155DBC0B|nr:hypothetical protein [Paeniclostridium sordellii]